MKWHGCLSSERKLPAGGPQGSNFGILGYLSQSNDNSNCVPVDDRYKYMDDLTMLEAICFMNIGLATFNLKKQVPNHIPVHNQVINSDSLKTQKYLDEIEAWTDSKKMVLNEKKTKYMIFNRSKKFQFTSDLKLKGEKLNIVEETKLLGTIITSDLKWIKNTQAIVENANIKMRMLQIAAKFIKRKEDLLHIYKTFIRSRLENSCVVWHSSLSKENELDLERVQKSAVKVILKEGYTDYKSGLKTLNIESLYDRREKLCLRFAKKCLKIENFKKLFPLKKSTHDMKKRMTEKFYMKTYNTERYQRSAIPAMIRLMNKEELRLKKALNSVKYVPREHCSSNLISVKI